MNVKKALYRISRISLILVPLFMALTTTTVTAASVSLRWDPNDPTPEGYRVFARRTDEIYNYSQPNRVTTSVVCTIDNLEERTEYYFVVRAYDGNLESADSEEVHYIPPYPVINGVDGTTPPPTNPDTDDDGIPDRVDRDDDDDGMPDDWETVFGLNPTVDDAEADLDQDGISNHDEYRAGLEPDDPGLGIAPQQPTVVSPAPYAQVGTNPVLNLEDYWDADGDAHIATQWQVYNAASGECLLDVVTDRRLYLLRVPRLLLNGGSTYHWRVRFFDSHGRASAWSASSYFVTDEAVNDLDGNGISDDQEGGLNQADVSRSFSSPVLTSEPTGIVVISNDTITGIEQVVLIDPADFEIDETTPVQLPSAMVAYKLLLNQPGERARVTIHLSDPAPNGARWVKYDEVNGWQDYSDHAELSADRHSVAVEVKDGDYGDADGVANGIILDPAGLSTLAGRSSPPAIAGDSGGGGGCFIATLHATASGTDTGGGTWQWIKSHMHRLLADTFNHYLNIGINRETASKHACGCVREKCSSAQVAL